MRGNASCCADSEHPNMLDRSILGTSWESVVSRDDYDVDYSPRESPIKETANGGDEDQTSYCISRHNPNRTFRRESVIASWKHLKREREQALGKRFVFVEESPPDYYGRNKVKRCTSDRSAIMPRIPKKVKRTYSVLYRYDPTEERVVKEYKYQPTLAPPVQSQPLMMQHKWKSEPFLTPQRTTKKKKAKRSFTTLLNIKTKFLNIFTLKS